MNVELSKRQFRRLLDMAYIGNWVLNSMRGDQRFEDYDQVEHLLFAKALDEGMEVLGMRRGDEVYPSKAFVDGGIHSAIAEYEGFVFYDILAEDLAYRDMGDVPIGHDNFQDFMNIVDKYMAEFEENGTDNLALMDDDFP